MFPAITYGAVAVVVVVVVVFVLLVIVLPVVVECHRRRASEAALVKCGSGSIFFVFF